MITVGDIARKVADEVKPASDKYGFDFVTVITMIIELLQNILPILQDLCEKDPYEVVKMAENPGILQRVWLRWQSRKVLGRKVYRSIGPDVVTGTLKVGATLKAQDIADLYNESNLVLY